MSSPKEIDLKCPICEQEKTAFICVKCICSGDFDKSTMFYGHRCTADTAITFDAKDATIVKCTIKDQKAFSKLLEAEKTKINERFEELVAEYKKLEEIESYIAEYEFKISNIKNLIKLRKSEATLAEERSRSMVTNEERLRTRIESTPNISKEMRVRIDRDKSRVADVYAETNKIEAEIKKKNRENLLKLKDLFHFEKKDSPMFYNQDTQTSASTDSETDVINDRSRSSGSWTRQIHQHYCIVESWIPGNTNVFDYSEFMALSKQRKKLNKEFEDLHLNDDNITRDNPAFRITAALSNISQIISVASDILDIRLPKKQKFYDFYTAYDCYNTPEPELFPSDNELLHRVAKLNANIIYLCLSQNVHFDLLIPSLTGKNLNAFFDPNNSNLGRTGPISIPQDIHRVIEDSLLPDNNLYTDFEDFEFIEEGDWEAVPRSSVINIPHDNQSTITSESILTNLAETWYNAVTSFIRG